jgi:Protein of unknown function (DUF4435)
MISYSARAARALGFLKRNYNDIEIFVEDTAGHAIWLRIIRNLLPDTIAIQSVNLMGGKKNVIDACKRDQSYDGRKRLYIIDADFDLLTRKLKPKLRHLYRLRTYCIENVLLHPKCIAGVCADYDPSISISNIVSKLEYDKMIGMHEELLRSLFIVYAASQEVGAGIETVSFSVYKLLSKKGGLDEFDQAKIRFRIKDVIRRSARAVGVGAFSKKRRELKVGSIKLGLDNFVSGKDCILPIIWLRARARHGYPRQQEHFKLDLAKEFKPECEPFLAKKLSAICG